MSTATQAKNDKSTDTTTESVTDETSDLMILVSEDDLSHIGRDGRNAFEDAMALINKKFGGDVVNVSEEIGTGFGVVDDKMQFVGVGLVILKTESHDGDHGKFWTLHAVTKDGRKIILNDGSTGIAAQLDAFYERFPQRRHLPLVVHKGLRQSTYPYDDHGQTKMATTFYLDTSLTA